MKFSLFFTGISMGLYVVSMFAEGAIIQECRLSAIYFILAAIFVQRGE